MSGPLSWRSPGKLFPEDQSHDVRVRAKRGLCPRAVKRGGGMLVRMCGGGNDITKRTMRGSKLCVESIHARCYGARYVNVRTTKAAHEILHGQYLQR